MILSHNAEGTKTRTFISFSEDDRIEVKADGRGKHVVGRTLFRWAGTESEIEFRVSHLPMLEELVNLMRRLYADTIDDPPIDISTLRGCVVGPDEMDDIREPRKGLAGANCFVEGRPIVAEAACDVSPMDPSLDEG